LKICYLANASSIHTVRWARHFSRRGHDVTVLTFTDSKIEGVKTVCLPASGQGARLNLFGILPTVRRIVGEMHPDILHAHYVTSYGLAGALCGYHPFVATAWGDDVLIDPERSFLYRIMVRWVFSRADFVTSMADHMTELMIKRGYVKPDRIITLPFGVDTSMFNPGIRVSKSDGQPLTVISTRHLSAEYDVRTLIAAIPLILNKLPDTRFIIVGEGELRSSLERMTDGLGVSTHVSFVGRVDHETLSRLLGQSDIFVTTSLSDGNNISLNEAMACGLLNVASDIPANREWIIDGESGFLFRVGYAEDLAERVIQAAGSPELRRRAAEMNWRIIQERGSWRKNMDRMENYYMHLLQGKM
jgi:glycosyltransferase involved in cell wall biosynthesis